MGDTRAAGSHLCAGAFVTFFCKSPERQIAVVLPPPKCSSMHQVAMTTCRFRLEFNVCQAF
jgi:hypothetical protein